MTRLNVAMRLFVGMRPVMTASMLTVWPKVAMDAVTPAWSKTFGAVMKVSRVNVTAFAEMARCEARRNVMTALTQKPVYPKMTTAALP